MDSLRIPTGYERALPPGVLSAVRARRRALVRRARGRVLDLGGADAHRSLWSTIEPVTDVVAAGGADLAPHLEHLARSGERFDTVLSVFRLTAVGDLDGALGSIETVLADGGALLFLEPGLRRGALGRGQRLVAPGVEMTSGWHVERDIPAALRRSGLSVIDIERHRIGTVQWWLGMLLEGVAHHALDTTGS